MASPSTTTARTTPRPARCGTTLPGGTILRVVEFSPGVQSRNHRTNSIDYAIIMSGEIDMEMDGTMIHLKAGDVLVQRGTIHNWINTGSAPCVIAFVADRRQAGDAQAARCSTRWDETSPASGQPLHHARVL